MNKGIKMSLHHRKRFFTFVSSNNKKRRKGYRVKNGHRDFLTSITIDAISA